MAMVKSVNTITPPQTPPRRATETDQPVPTSNMLKTIRSTTAASSTQAGVGQVTAQIHVRNTGEIEPAKNQEGHHDRDGAGHFPKIVPGKVKMTAQFNGCQHPEGQERPDQVAGLFAGIDQSQQQRHQRPNRPGGG